MSVTFIVITILFGIAAGPMMKKNITGPRMIIVILLLVAGIWAFCLLPIQLDFLVKVITGFFIMDITAIVFGNVSEWKAYIIEKKSLEAKIGMIVVFSFLSRFLLDVKPEEILPASMAISFSIIFSIAAIVFAIDVLKKVPHKKS